jgi:hypothetical protein
LAVSVIGATIPGFLSVGLSTRGLFVRAGGALALFVLTYFFSPQVVPNIQPAVTFGLRDVTTGQRIDRPFKVEYRVDGPVMRQDCSSGLCPITARSAKDVEILAVICDGYSLESRDDRTLNLKRVEPDESDEMVDDEFLVAITPDKHPYDYDTVSRATYIATTSREVPPEEVVFTVVNQTDDFLDILYHHYTQGQEDAFEGWGRLPPCAPRQSVSKSSFGKKGGYYFVFGSRFGRKAEFLGQRNLYLTRTPKLYVSDANGTLRPAWEDAPLAAQ